MAQTIFTIAILKRYWVIMMLSAGIAGHTVLSSVSHAAQKPTYEAQFTFIKYGVHRASSSLMIQPNGTAQLIVDQRHGYKINLSLMEKAEETTLNIKFALKDSDRWVQVSDVTSKVRLGVIARYDIDISDAKIKDAKGRRINKLSFGLKVKESA